MGRSYHQTWDRMRGVRTLSPINALVNTQTVDSPGGFQTVCMLDSRTTGTLPNFKSGRMPTEPRTAVKHEGLSGLIVVGVNLRRGTMAPWEQFPERGHSTQHRAQ